MNREIFGQIKELKEQGNLADAWDVGYIAFQQEPTNTFLRTSLFWVCYAGIKAVQTSVLGRENSVPSQHEAQTVNGWINCIGQLKMPVPCEELDYRFFNQFKGCGEHYQSYLEMVLYYGAGMFVSQDYEPYKMEKGEYPSLAVRIARQVAKAWLAHQQQWGQDVQPVLALLESANEKAGDRNKTWLQFDIAKCLVAAGRHQEARDAALTVLRKKMSESWAWGSLASTYVIENPEIALACYCKGITEAHEPPFTIPMYSAMAKIFVQLKDYQKASASLLALSEIYKSNGWTLKDEYQGLMNQEWFDSSVSQGGEFTAYVSEAAKNALQYGTGPTEKLVGVVDSHHRSEKGFSIYVELGKKVSARKGVYKGKGLPELGSWVELNCVEGDGRLEAVDVVTTAPRDHQHILWSEGELRVNPSGFAFADDAFVANHLVDKTLDGKHVKVLKVWDIDPKKGRPSWRAIQIRAEEGSRENLKKKL